MGKNRVYAALFGVAVIVAILVGVDVEVAVGVGVEVGSPETYATAAPAFTMPLPQMEVS